MPGYNIRMQNGEMREGLRCFLCKLLLKDPVQASETGERYCTECFKETVRFATPSFVYFFSSLWTLNAGYHEVRIAGV